MIGRATDPAKDGFLEQGRWPVEIGIDGHRQDLDFGRPLPPDLGQKRIRHHFEIGAAIVAAGLIAWIIVTSYYRHVLLMSIRYWTREKLC